MEPALQDAVRIRARHRCEYCHFPEQFAELPFHVNHIVARQHGGRTELENLAFACCYCNRHKGPNLTGIDPDSGEIAGLFDPRRHGWSDHFGWDGPQLMGKTPAARATIRVLAINRADAVAVRALLIQEGVFPSGETH